DLREEYINYVRLSGERLLNTINDIIDISKIETGAIIISESVVDINDILRNQYDLFRSEAETKGLDFKVEGFSESLRVFIDRKKLESILSNLLKNAIKFTSRGYIHLNYCNEDGKLVFKVSDSGIGIASDRILNIFDRFVQADFSFTRNHEGLGLGLAISKAYANMLGGNINVHSQPDEGSTFILDLPYKPLKDTILEKTQLVENNADSSNEITILVAEDDEVSYSYLKAVIKKTGIKMIRVTDGQDAIDACISNPSLSVVFMDIKMPTMDGYEATRQIRKFNTGIPIIALTAFAFSNDREKAILSGCNDYISKPVKKEAFLEIINKYTRKE
ncbi:MAG: hybrid sensor histidine kinase/response regulator, partial [Omnitrophica WOR_2 bacterium]